MSYSDSSEPDSTTYSGVEDVASADSGSDKKEQVVIESPDLKKKKKSFPVTCIVLLELVLPICYLINSISTQSVMGLINIVIMIANVIISNMTKTKATGYKVILSIELLYNIILLICISVFSYQSDAKENEILKIMGLDFNNTVVKSPTLTIVICCLAIVLEILAFFLLSRTKQEEMIAKRRKFYGSMGWMFTADLVWSFCIAYVGAANTSYLYAPILIYFAYISVTMGLIGKPLVPHWAHYIVNVYSTIYSLYLFFQVSYIGSKYSLSEYINFQKISKPSLDGLMLSANIIQIWFSVQLLFAFAHHNEQPKMPQFLIAFSDVTLVLSFLGILIYAIFYPCYISITWTIIVFFASFFGLKATRKVFFRLMAVIYNITFICIYATSVDFYPYDKVDKKILGRLQEVGLYNFRGDFTFTLLGFFIAAILAQIGRIVHAEKEVEIEVEEIVVSKKRKAGQKVVEVVDNEEEEQPSKFAIFLEKTKEFLKKAFIFLTKYVSVGAVVVLSLVYAYAPNEICFHVVFLIALVMSVIGSYKKFAFNIIKLICGLILISTTFFYTNQNDFNDEKFSWIKKVGIAVPEGKGLNEYIWPHLIIFILCVVITNMDEVSLNFPPKIVAFFFWIVCFLHILYVYLYGPNIFSVTYVIGGVALFASQVLDKVFLTKTLTVFSGLSVSIHQLVLLFSEYDDLRNFFQAVIPTSVIDIREPAKPCGETALLAITIFFISLTYQNSKRDTKEKSQYIVGIGEELKAAVRSFYFYITWIFIFFFSICNDYPTVIKGILSLLFLLGSKIAKFFNKMVKVLMIFMVIFLAAQMVVEVFPDTVSGFKLAEYIGLYFGKEGYTRADRNISMTWQLLFILISIINIIASDARPTTPEFDSCLPMRIYRAIYTMLHDFMTVFVDISLCISTLYNPTIFGFLSFIVLIIVQFKPAVLQRGAVIITILFNLSFIFQYMVWLGLPSGRIIVPGLDNEWGDFLSLRNVDTSALLTNCLSAFVLTFYLQFRTLVLNKEMVFDDLPDVLKAIIKFFVTNIFEICESIAVAVSVLVTTFDGVFFFVLIGLLLFSTLLFNFDSHKTVSIHLWGMFFVIFARILSRIPYFTESGVGRIISSAFGLPFRGHSNTEYIWIILFSLESLLIHIMDTDMYKQCRKDNMQRLAYRFVRIRQLKLISRLNQDVLEALQDKRIEKIKRVGENAGKGHKTKENENNEEEEEENEEKIEEEEEEEDKDKTFLETIKESWTWVFDKLFSPMITSILENICKTVPLNSETGVNVLTLNSIHAILRREVGVIRSNGVFTLTQAEQEFLEKLPPSFSRQISCISKLLHPKPIGKDQFFECTIRYLGLILRRLSLPALILVSVIFLYLKPYLFSLIIFLYIMVFFTGAQIYGKPGIYRLFYIILILMLCFRGISTVDIVSNSIKDYISSVSYAHSKVDIPSLLGINPYDSSAIEIFVFLIGIWYIVDELHNAVVFPPNYYQQIKFTGANKLEGFPDKYYYNFDNAENILGLSIKQTPGIFQQIKDSTNKLRLKESSNYLYSILFDVIAFIVMLFGIGGWTEEVNENNVSSVGQSSFKFTYMLIFALALSTVFIMVLFLCHVSNNFTALYIANTVQIVCVLIFAFFITNNPYNSGLQLYIFLKIVSVLIVYQDTYLGKFVANFNYPDVEKDGTYIICMNSFIRFCPFVFEIYSLLMWMSKTSKVKLQQFMIIQDLKGQLENQLVALHKKKVAKKDEKNKDQHTFIVGGLFILLIIVVLFAPLCFLVEGSLEKFDNTLLSSELEIGFTELGPIYKANGIVSHITSEQHNKLANSGYSDINKFKHSQENDMFVVDFASESLYAMETRIKDKIVEESTVLTPYFRITNTYSYETTSANSRTISIQQNGYRIEGKQMNDLKDVFRKKITTAVTPAGIGTEDSEKKDVFQSLISLPLGFYTPSDTAASVTTTACFAGIKVNSNGYVKLSIELPPGATFTTNTHFKLFVWSDEIFSDSIGGALFSDSNGIIVIYVLIIITFGVVIREATLGQYEDLWIQEMKYPENLYRYIIAIEAFRSVGSKDKELEMTEKMISVVRSKEQCIQLTDSPEKGDDE